MKTEEIKEKAKSHALRIAPTENGMFDGKARLIAYIEHCIIKGGLHVWIGNYKDLTDQDIDYHLMKFGLDRE